MVIIAFELSRHPIFGVQILDYKQCNSCASVEVESRCRAVRGIFKLLPFFPGFVWLAFSVVRAKGTGSEVIMKNGWVFRRQVS